MKKAIIITLLKDRDFTTDDFAQVSSSPGEVLREKDISLYIDNLIHTKNHMPTVKPNCMLDKALRLKLLKKVRNDECY